MTKSREEELPGSPTTSAVIKSMGGHPPRLLPLIFRSACAACPVSMTVFDVKGGEGQISIRGGLSAGTLGWTLSASAMRRRNVIDFYITARRAPAAGTVTPAIEDHTYEAILEMPPGLYRLKLRHVYLSSDARPTPPGLPVFERSIKVS